MYKMRIMTMRSIREITGVAVLCAVATVAVACAAGKAEPKGDAVSNTGDVVARVGDVKITLTELDKEAMRQSITPFQALYDARSAALDAMIEKLLLEQEAVLRGISLEDLVTQEIASKIQPVGEAEINAFFAQNQNRMGGKSLEEMSPTIRNYLASMGGAQSRQAFVSTLRAKGAVRVSLDPPRAEVVIAANDPSRGPKGAPITIVEYSDFQ